MKDPKNDDQCFYCKFSLFYEKGRLAEMKLGYCCRYAPRPEQNANVKRGDPAPQTVWPIVSTNDWCGEYQDPDQTYVPNARFTTPPN